MATHTDTPSTGYYVELDVTLNDQEEFAIFRRELQEDSIHVVILEWDGPAGWPLVRLRANGPARLTAWMEAAGYGELVGRIINARQTRADARVAKAITTFGDGGAR
jgi:hypothetical protein